jgi:hypothetical protein
MEDSTVNDFINIIFGYRIISGLITFGRLSCVSGRSIPNVSADKRKNERKAIPYLS